MIYNGTCDGLGDLSPKGSLKKARTKVNPVRQLDLLISSKNKEWFRQHSKPKQNNSRQKQDRQRQFIKQITPPVETIEADRGMKVSKGKCFLKTILFRRKARNKQEYLSSEDFDPLDALYNLLKKAS